MNEYTVLFVQMGTDIRERIYKNGQLIQERSMSPHSCMAHIMPLLKGIEQNAQEWWERK